VDWIIVCTALGTGTGGSLAVGNVHSGTDGFFFKVVGGVGSISSSSNIAQRNDAGMSSANVTYSVGGSNNLQITLVAPSTAGTGSTFRSVANVRLVEVAW
jgi:hypothetical protein